MQGDREAEIVDAPQILEQQLGLHARVDEQQAQAVRLDRRVDLADGVARRVADRRHRLVELENVDLRLGAAADEHEVGHLDARLRRVLRHEIGAQLGWSRHGRRQPDGAQPRRQLAQPRQRQGEKVAALGRRQRVDLVENDGVEVGEQIGAVGVAEQQRQLLRRRHQDVGRRAPLPRAARHRRVAGARLGADRQLHLRDRRRQVARHVDGQRLQRRDIESVQTAPAVGARALRQAHQAGQEAGERLAGPGRRDQQGGAPLPGRFDQGQLMRPRGPPACGEPRGERLGQSRHDGRARLLARAAHRGGRGLSRPHTRIRYARLS